ncbi:hypothetical protein WJX73_003843 [Symbiochloris irregularis]|uniref:Peptidase M20 dimerisation domain-containing protein n=1 Tax=Symbiochloris irregularis TaxID=706552 RepID=A0AAW1NSL0_9CHLO
MKAITWIAVSILAAACALLYPALVKPSQINLAIPEQIHCSVDDKDAAVERFAGLLRFKTVSSPDNTSHLRDESAAENLQKYLRKSYAIIDSKLDRTQVARYSLLLKWPGSDASLRPAVFISHTDVVDVGDESAWSHPPFSGANADGYIWGRGAQDVKVTVAQMLEAVTLLSKEGFKPRRTAYLAFGHDEEVGGALGARAIAKLLHSQGVVPEVILDEGGVLLTDGIKGVTDVPCAVVAVAEKGYVSLELTITGRGGHSSMPSVGKPNVLTQLAKVLHMFHANPPPIKVVDPVPQTFTALSAGARNPLLRWFLSHATQQPWNWLLGRVLAASPSAEVAALVRTTAAVTDVKTGPPGDNVLPDTAIVTFNFRTLPGQDPGWPAKYLRRLCIWARLEPSAFTVREKGRDAASDVTDVLGPHFEAVKAALLETLTPAEGLIVAPNLLSGRTDSGNYEQYFPSTPTLRFTPLPASHAASAGIGDWPQAKLEGARPQSNRSWKMLAQFEVASGIIVTALQQRKDCAP